MSLPLLGESNVTTTIITPFMQLELLPDGLPNWGLSQNNNWIRVENTVQGQLALIEALDASTDTSVASIEEDIGALTTQVENESITRAQQVQDLQDDIDAIELVGATFVRQTGVVLTAGVPFNVVHNLGKSPLSDIFRESDGIVVSHHFDTIITHLDINTLSIEVGITGIYTIMAVG